MIRLTALILLLCLVACGADGEPTPPGARVSGTAQVGVTFR